MMVESSIILHVVMMAEIAKSSMHYMEAIVLLQIILSYRVGDAEHCDAEDLDGYYVVESCGWDADDCAPQINPSCIMFNSYDNVNDASKSMIGDKHQCDAKFDTESCCSVGMEVIAVQGSIPIAIWIILSSQS